MILVDCVDRGTTSQAEASFRNSHFHIHIAQVEAYTLTGTRLDYTRPFWPGDFLLLGGAPWPTVPLHPAAPVDNTPVIDLTLLATRNRIRSTITAYMLAHPCEGIMLDTPFQYATGQDAQALEVLEGIRTDHPGQIVMLNFGDLFTWAQPTGTTKTTVASSYTYQFPQVAFDVDPSGTTLGDPSNYNTRLSLLTSTLNARSLAGKHVTLGFYDAGGAHAQIAEDIMTTCSAYSNTSMYYATVSFSNTMPLRQWQWNEALPEPVATQLVYPIGTSDVAPYTGDQYPNGHEWTPSSGGNGHHLLLDEVTPNETDKITVAGFSGGKVERIVMDNGGTDIVLVTSYRVSLHLNSSAIANAPALRARFYVNHVEKDMREFECDTGGSWDDIEYTINGLYIDAAEWYAGPIEVELTPINGDAGYLPAS